LSSLQELDLKGADLVADGTLQLLPCVLAGGLPQLHALFLPGPGRLAFWGTRRRQRVSRAVARALRSDYACVLDCLLPLQRLSRLEVHDWEDTVALQLAQDLAARAGQLAVLKHDLRLPGNNNRCCCGSSSSRCVCGAARIWAAVVALITVVLLAVAAAQLCAWVVAGWEG
jgi:hypothetical protein